MDHSSNKRPDFGKLPVENLSNLHESFKEILRDLNSHENYVEYFRFYEKKNKILISVA